MSFIPASASTSIDPAELAKFEAMAATWWDERGPMKPLHLLNPLRINYLVSVLAAGKKGSETLAGISLLDVGCGGGLLSEPLACLGATVTGIDAVNKNIRVAEAHARMRGIAINYQVATAEGLAAEGKQFDAVLAMEIIEHVADPALFMASLAALVKPGGKVIVSTLNRTLKSYAVAIVGAEYLLRWLPCGTHEWKKFLTPLELIGVMKQAGLAVSHVQGMGFDPLRWKWRLTPDKTVNYVVVAEKR